MLLAWITNSHQRGASWFEYSQNRTTSRLIKTLANTTLLFVRVNPIIGLGMGIFDLTGATDLIQNEAGKLIDNNF